MAAINQPIILLLEHDDDDLYITETLFEELGFQATLRTVKTSSELFDVLENGRKTGERLPTLILLNYNASPVGAAEFVGRLKSNVHVKHIPVVVGCGVVNQKMLIECYQKGVASFIQKANNTEAMKRSMIMFFDYWFKCVMLPDQA